MEKQIFPFQLINPSVEALHARHSRRGTAIYWVVLASLIGFMCSMPFLKVEVTSRSRGMIRSDIANNQLVSAVTGQIQRVFITNNQFVEAGDTLLTFRQVALDEQRRALEERMRETRLLANDYSRLNQHTGSAHLLLNTLLAQRELNQYSKQRAEYALRIQYAQQQADKQQQLLNSGNTARIQYEQALHELGLAQSSLDLLTEQSQRNWAEEAHRYNMELQELSTQHRRLVQEGDQYVLKAAISGNITQFMDVQPGNFISAGQALGEISKSNNLLVETYVSPTDVGLIHMGMAVQFQVDAFNSHQWGMVYGTVVDISKDIVIMQDNPVFIIKCSIDKNNLHLKNGYKGQLQKGMTLTAHFTVAKRSLFDLLYDKVDDWIDPYQR